MSRYPVLGRGPICPQALFSPVLRDFLLALGTDGKFTLERCDHAVGNSPCQLEAPEAWAFSGSAIRLTR